jgi:hypothetical protein
MSSANTTTIIIIIISTNKTKTTRASVSMTAHEMDNTYPTSRRHMLVNL